MTYCRLAELLVGHLLGEVGPHQDGHWDAQQPADHPGDELDTTAVGMVKALHNKV